MSLLDKQRELEDAPDSFLQQLLQQGDKQYPAWLVHTVADARADMRQRFQNQEALAQAEQPKIVDNTIAKLGGIPDVDPNQAGGDPSLATGIAGGMAGGGVIREYAIGDLVGDDEDEEEEGVGGGEVEAALTEMEIEEAAVREGISAAQGRIEQQKRDAEEWVGRERREGRFVGLEDYPAHLTQSERTTTAMGGRDLMEMSPEQKRGWDVLLAGAEPGTAEYRDIEQQMGTPVKKGLFGNIRRARDPEEYVPFSAESVLGLDPIYSTTYRPEGDEQEQEQEATDEELDELLKVLTGDSDALTASREQRGYHRELVNQGMGFIGDVETARQWDERHDEVQRRKAVEQRTVMKNARDIAQQRGENAEDRQEIYDTLMNNFSTQITDLESVRADRARQQEEREAGMPRRLRAAALRQARTGDESITTAAESWQEELDSFRTDEDNLMTQLRNLTVSQYDKGIAGLKDVQQYKMKTDEDLDQAVLDNIRFSTGQFEEEAFHDDLLQDELLDDRLGLLKSALSGAGQIDIAGYQARTAAANAQLASTSAFKNYASNPDNWPAIELQIRDLQQAYDKGSPEREQLEEALQFIGEDAVSSLIQQARVGGSSTEGLSLEGQNVKGAVGGAGGRDDRLIPVLEAILEKIPAGDRTPFIELIREHAG